MLRSRWRRNGTVKVFNSFLENLNVNTFGGCVKRGQCLMLKEIHYPLGAKFSRKRKEKEAGTRYESTDRSKTPRLVSVK
jgi:hypothetical protein